MDKNLVSYKALRFTTESNRSSMLYEVKRARAIFDPSLAVPGTSRRGGFRCPVGTRYGGQITDRFGRNCGWGVARRLANEISDLGERLESVGDRRRERKLRKRNDRMAGRLAGAPGAIERAAGRVGDALDLTGRQGGQRNRVGAEAPRPTGRLERAAGRLADVVDPDKPNRGGRARRADAPQAPSGRDRGRDLTPDNAADTPARPAREEREDVNLLAAEPTEVLEEMREELENATDGRDSDDYKRVMAELKRRKATRGRRQNNANPRPRPAAAKRPRRNLRASEERRMQREIDNPGAARTDVDAAPAPAARPRPAAPRRPANAGRRRRPEPANNRDTASRQNEGRPARKPTAVPAGQSDNAARSAEVREREAKPDRTITRDDNAGRLGERERDAKRIRRQMEENPNDDFFANPFNEAERGVFNNLDVVQDADLVALEKLIKKQRDDVQRSPAKQRRVEDILANVQATIARRRADSQINRQRNNGQQVDLNQALNDDNFEEYVVRDVIPNDKIMILNDDRNFPDSAARKRSKADEARQKITVATARLERLEQAIARGEINDKDFIELPVDDPGQREVDVLPIARVKRHLEDYRNAWQEVYDRNNAQPARAENTVEQARRQVEEARNPRSVPADLRMGFDIPDDGLDKAQLRRMLGNNMDDDYVRRVQEGIIQNRDVQLPQNMAAWSRGDLVELRANVQVQENALDDARRELREAADAFGNAGDEDKEDAARNVIDKNGQVQRVMDTRNAFKRRAAELEGNDAPNAPEPSRTPSAPREPSAAAQQAARIGGDDDVRGRTPAQWRAFFEAQGAPNVNERVSRANNAVNDGVGRADADFNGAFNGGGDALMRMRDRDGILPKYEERLAYLDEVVASKKRNYDAREGQGINDNFLVAQRDLIVAIAHRDRYKERKAEIDAALAAPAPEPLNPELARQAEQRVKDAIEGRQRTLALHLDRQYGAGNAPWKEMTLQKRQELLRDAQGRGPEASAARNQLEAWAKAMYSHPEIQGSNGKTYRSVATASLSGNQITVSVNFEVKNANGTWTNMGDSSRYLDLNAGVVRNGTMFIRGNDHKNNGIQTVYNQHAFMYAKAAGFEKITVGTADDGPYVWGRIGFEAPIPNTHVSNLNTQLNAFRRGDTSIIKNEEDANIIEYLIEKHKDNPNSVRHMDFIYALTNPYGNDEREAKRARDKELRDWFATNMGLGSGTFYLDKNLIKADPRDEE